MNDKTHPMSDEYDWSEPKAKHGDTETGCEICGTPKCLIPRPLPIPLPLPPPPPPPPPTSKSLGLGRTFTQCPSAGTILGVPFDTNRDNSDLFQKVTFNRNPGEDESATVFTINSEQLEILVNDPGQWEAHGFDLDLLDNSCFHVVLTGAHQFHGCFAYNDNLKY